MREIQMREKECKIRQKKAAREVIEREEGEYPRRKEGRVDRIKENKRRQENGRQVKRRTSAFQKRREEGKRYIKENK
jgi:hypothetical protein